MSTVIAIVKSHEGFAQVQSAPGKGAIFKVFLPAMEKPLEPANLTQPTMMPRGNGETILVVEDEAAILNATCQTLTAFGYRVLSARDGAEALAVYSANKARIAIVLTDMMMPGMDGANLVGALLNLNPAIKIVQANGFILDSSRNSVPPTADKHFLAKPYTAERLLKTMRARLDEA